MKTTIQLLIPRTVKLAFVIIILAVFDPAALSQKANSNSQPGSILFFNRYTSDPNNPQLSDTQINITNTDPIEKAFVHLFFIDGTTGSNADYSISMQPNQTLSFLTSDIDPSVSGYIIAVA
ncbi:MAG: hypothetical protein J2P41_24175, partial [Blastocatellia bacterium]|nr:hypothetical protein [Blastocatellia bacterium]